MSSDQGRAQGTNVRNFFFFFFATPNNYYRLMLYIQLWNTSSNPSPCLHENNKCSTGFKPNISLLDVCCSKANLVQNRPAAARPIRENQCSHQNF